MAHPWPSESTGHPWRTRVDPSYYTDGPKATGATTGVGTTPGTWTPAGSAPVNTFAEMTGVTASPGTNWLTTTRMVLGDGSLAHWNGTAWVAGAHP